jgi:hypothetical protein
MAAEKLPAAKSELALVKTASSCAAAGDAMLKDSAAAAIKMEIDPRISGQTVD